MTKTIKLTLICLLTALLALAAVCLTANPIKQTKADETYSETWVIKEKWTCTKDIDVNIGLKINGNISADRIVFQATNPPKGVLYALGNESLKPLTQLYNDGNYMYFRSDGEISAFSYSEWKDTFGKIIFCADTSAAEYAELRAWLNENASLYVKVNTITFMQDGTVKHTATLEDGKAFNLGGTEIVEAMKKDGYTLKGYATAENGEIVYAANSSFTPTSDVTLYGVYVKVNTITFMQDGTVKLTATPEEGKSLNLGGAAILDIMKKGGYTLKGYATTENGEIVYAADASFTPTEDMALYAVYEQDTTPDTPVTPDNANDNDKTDSNFKTKSVLISIPLFVLLIIGLASILHKIKKS